MTVLFPENRIGATSAVSEPASQGPAKGTTPNAPLATSDTSAAVTSGPDVVAFIELLFFAYRDFVHDPDAILEEIGFGRAHHRVLHFVYRHPGIRVSRLLTVLNITKQSLARVLRQLIEEAYVEQREGINDRRERCLFLSPTGVDLFERLLAPQRARVTEALNAAGASAERAFDGTTPPMQSIERFLETMIEAPDRETIKTLIEAGVPVRKPDAEAA